METCLTGLYWLYASDEDIARMRGENAWLFRRLFNPIADGDVITPDLVDDIASTMGPRGRLPTLQNMADAVASRTGKSFANDIYDRLYVPLSTFVAHASGPALLRHVRSDHKLDVKPEKIWTIRSRDTPPTLARQSLPWRSLNT